jgi:hypothetical protein
MDLIIVAAALVSFFGLVISQIVMPERRSTVTKTKVVTLPKPAILTKAAAAVS